MVLKPVQVEIKEFAILAVEGDRARFRARVASGTYMRSVAHEMGQLLGSGAHLESLRRTAVAEFDITQAHTLEEIKAKMKEGLIKEGQRNEEQINEELINDCHSDRSFAFPRGQGSGVEEPAVAYAITAFLIHPRQLLPQFPSVTADELTAARIRSGRPVNLPELSRANQVKVFYGQRGLIAIATRIAGTLFHPKIVFAAEPSAADTPVRRP